MFGNIASLNIVLLAFSFHWNSKIHVYVFKNVRDSPLNKRLLSFYKNAIFKKGHRSILIKITFLDSAHRQLSNGIYRFF